MQGKDYVLLVALGYALYTDIRQRKIYNWLTLGLSLFALGSGFAGGGIAGLARACVGLAVGGAIFLLPYLLGGVGAGDVKLFAAVGAVKGVEFVLRAGAWAGIIGGVCALLILVRKRVLLATLKRMADSLQVALGGAAAGNLRFQPPAASGFTFPYAIPLVLGTLCALWL